MKLSMNLEGLVCTTGVGSCVVIIWIFKVPEHVVEGGDSTEDGTEVKEDNDGFKGRGSLAKGEACNKSPRANSSPMNDQ